MTEHIENLPHIYRVISSASSIGLLKTQKGLFAIFLSRDCFFSEKKKWFWVVMRVWCVLFFVFFTRLAKHQAQKERGNFQCPWGFCVVLPMVSDCRGRVLLSTRPKHSQIELKTKSFDNSLKKFRKHFS